MFIYSFGTIKRIRDLHNSQIKMKISELSTMNYLFTIHPLAEPSRRRRPEEKVQPARNSGGRVLAVGGGQGRIIL